MHYPIRILLVILLATGCATSRNPIVAPVDINFNVQINGRYDSLPNYTRIYFQDGMRKSEGDLDEWITFCRLHVYNPDKKADYVTSVKPGSFGISSVKLRAESSDGINYPPGFHMFYRVGMSTSNSAFWEDWEKDGGPAYFLFRVEMKLNSADQPDIQTLICAKKSVNLGNYYPTLSEIRLALGNLIVLRPMSISN